MFSRPPLPFYGNKSNLKNHIKKIIEEYFPDDSTYVDLFGGSLFLSHMIKILKPKSKVIVNDYDNYLFRLQNIDQTNNLFRQIHSCFNTNYKPATKMTDEDSKAVKELITTTPLYKDWITLGSKLTYSGSFIANEKQFMKAILYYNQLNPITVDLSTYLKDIEIVHSDWEELYEQYKTIESIIFIADPPYKDTNTTTYKNAQINYQKLYHELIKREKFMIFSHGKDPYIKQLPNDLYKSFTFNRTPINKKCKTIEKNEIILINN